MNLKNYAKQIHEIAVEKGWWDEERTDNELVLLIDSELTEAFEEYRNNRPYLYWRDAITEKIYYGNPPNEFNKPEGIAVELVDTVIRILDIFAARHIEPIVKKINIDLQHDFIDIISHCKQYLFGWEDFYVIEIVHLILSYFNKMGWDFECILKLKIEYNKTRPYKQGGKRL